LVPPVLSYPKESGIEIALYSCSMVNLRYHSRVALLSGLLLTLIVILALSAPVFAAQPAGHVEPAPGASLLKITFPDLSINAGHLGCRLNARGRAVPRLIRNNASVALRQILRRRAQRARNRGASDLRIARIRQTVRNRLQIPLHKTLCETVLTDPESFTPDQNGTLPQPVIPESPVAGKTICEAADFNNDLEVDRSDLNFLISHFGRHASLADLDSSGLVDANDLRILLALWGPVSRCEASDFPNSPPAPSDPDKACPEKVFASSIQRHGVTWYFDKEYEVGQFVNGDWWVKPEEEGSVRILSVDPMPEFASVPVAYNPISYGDRYINGSMLNPRTETQAYDSRVAAFNASLGVQYPVDVEPDSSLVSSISTTEFNCSGGQGAGNFDLRGTCIPGRHRLKGASVLTVLADTPPENTFRPAFAGTNKELYSSNDIYWERLPDLDIPADAPENLDYYLRGLERPWITHIAGANSRSLHPFENMLGYHAVIYNFYNDISYLTLANYPQRNELVKLYLQHAIDMYSTILDGQAGSGTSKHPLMLAGLLFDKQHFYEDINTRSLTPFRTDYMTYYGDAVTSPVISDCRDDQGVQIPECTIVPDGQFYHGYAVGWGQGGIHREYEHLDPLEWHKTQQCGEDGTRCESYRHINSTNWSGPALSMHLLGLTEEWDHAPFLDYVDRYVDQEGNLPDGFRGIMWQNYR